MMSSDADMPALVFICMYIYMTQPGGMLQYNLSRESCKVSRLHFHCVSSLGSTIMHVFICMYVCIYIYIDIYDSARRDVAVQS